MVTPVRQITLAFPFPILNNVHILADDPEVVIVQAAKRLDEKYLPITQVRTSS